MVEGAALSRLLREPTINGDLTSYLRAEKPWTNVPPPASERSFSRWVPEIPDSVYDRPLRIEPILTREPETAITPAAQRLGETFDKLEAALKFCASVNNFDRLLHRFPHLDAADSFDPQAIYRVLKSFSHLLTGEQFRTGEYVDCLMVPAPLLARSFATKGITPVYAGNRT
jgi:hypothetical protein